jgi:TPR repeat protein
VAEASEISEICGLALQLLIPWIWNSWVRSRGAFAFSHCLRKGEGVSQILIKAADMFKRLAAQGHPGGQWEYGYCLYKGLGVPEDKTEAFSYFKLSADQGNPLGRYRYA